MLDLPPHECPLKQREAWLHVGDQDEGENLSHVSQQLSHHEDECASSSIWLSTGILVEIISFRLRLGE